MTLMRVTLLPFAFLMALLACPGCSDPAADVDAARDAAVELLEVGQAPRSRLGYTRTGATEQSVDLTTKLTMGVDFNGQSMPAETIPATKTTLQLQADGPVDSARFDCRFRITGASIVDYGSDLERLALVNRELTNQDPVGRSGSLSRSVNGQVHQVELEIPASSTSTLRHFFGNLKQALEQVSVPLPAESIGPGARWKVSLPVRISGMDLTQVGTYELKRVEGDRLTIALSARMLAEVQLFQLPNMPASSRCELIELNGEATGEITVDRTLPFPVEAHLEYRFDMRMRVQNEGQTSQLNSHVELQFEVGAP